MFPAIKEFLIGEWITVDPGINTSITEWKNGDIVKTYTISPKFKEEQLIRFIGLHFRMTYSGNIKGCLIESTEFYTASLKSQVSGARGNLSLLAYISGSIVGNLNCKYTILVKPAKWKGQLNYEQLRNILTKKFKIETTNNHNASSIGIGLWAKGDL